MASATLTARLVGDAKGMVDAFDRGEQAAGKFGGALGRAGQIAAGFVVANVLLRAPDFLLAAANAAAEDEASVKRLQQAVENTGVSYEKYRGQLDATIKRGQALAFTDDQTRSALALLTAQTGSATEAQRRYAIAQDLSRGANIDVVTASRLLGKVTEENVNVLARYGIKVAEGTSETELFGIIQEKFAGQAQAFANSTAGQMARAKDQMSELVEALGARLLPIIVAGTGVLVTFLDHLDDFAPLIAGIGVAIAVAFIPRLVLLIATTWAHVAALTAQAIALAAANPWLAAAAIAAGVATAAYLKTALGSRDLSRETDRLTSKMEDATLATDGLAKGLQALSFSALAAKVAEAQLRVGTGEYAAQAGALEAQLRATYETEALLKAKTDEIIESYTHAEAKTAALTAAREADAEAAKQQAVMTGIVSDMVDKAVKAYEKLSDQMNKTKDVAFDLTVALWRANPNVSAGAAQTGAAVAQAAARQQAEAELTRRFMLPSTNPDVITGDQFRDLQSKIGVSIVVNSLDAKSAADAVAQALTQLERTGRIQTVTVP